MPACSNSRNCIVSICWVAWGKHLRNSLKRLVPLSREKTISGFHFPPIMERVTSTGLGVIFFCSAMDAPFHSMIFHTTPEFFAYLYFPHLSPILIVSLFDGISKLQSTYYADDKSSVCEKTEQGKKEKDNGERVQAPAVWSEHPHSNTAWRGPDDRGPTCRATRL